MTVINKINKKAKQHKETYKYAKDKSSFSVTTLKSKCKA
jgi:hypothetical protein